MGIIAASWGDPLLLRPAYALLCSLWGSVPLQVKEPWHHMSSLLPSASLFRLLGPLGQTGVRSKRKLIFGLLDSFLGWRKRDRLSWIPRLQFFDFCFCFLIERCWGTAGVVKGRAILSWVQRQGQSRGCCWGPVLGLQWKSGQLLAGMLRELRLILDLLREFLLGL